MQTRITDERSTVMFRSVTNECRHIFNPDIMLFGGIVGVFEKEEVHVLFSFAFGAAIFHREPFATVFEGQNVDGYGGVEFFEKGDLFLFGQENSTPRRLESVRNLCNLTNDMGDGRVDITPTTRSKRSISRLCFGR